MTKACGKVTRSKNPRPAFARGAFLIDPEYLSIEIAVWHPDAASKEPAQQVHFILHIRDELPDIQLTWRALPGVMAFKNTDSPGFLVEELTRYRRDVWPDAEPLTCPGRRRQGEGDVP